MKKFFTKRESEFLPIKEINKRVKEQTPLKEKDEENEYNLVIILKSLLNVLYNYSRQINLASDAKQELNIPALEEYFEQFQEKPYYNIKIEPILDVIKSYFILSKQEKGFIRAIKSIQASLNKNKKITDNQIDIINYILINRFQKFVGMGDSCEMFFILYNIFDVVNKKEYKYLFEYYTVILLISIYFVDFDKNPNKNKIGTEILQILYIILNNEKNADILEFAFLLFCEFHTKVDDVSFEIYTPIKWCLLILKLLKGKFLLFNFDTNEDNKLYDYIKSFHYKYFLGEIKRNKSRTSISDQMVSVGKNTSENIILPESLEEAQKYLNDKKYEKFPKELLLPRGPSNNIYKYLFEYYMNYANNKEQFKAKLEEKKRNIILSVLQICYFILKNNNYEEEEIDAKYFSLKLSKEIVSIFSSFYKDKSITRLSLLCLAKMFPICPENIIQYLPSIFETLKYLGDKKNKYFIYLCGSLDSFFKIGSEVIRNAYEQNNKRIINEINKIYNTDKFFMEIYSLVVIINNLPNMKIVKKVDKNPDVNFDSLLINSFNFFIIFVNEFFLVKNYITLTGEAILTTLIAKHSSLYLKNYMTTILCKIYNKNVLTSIYNNLLIGESNALKYKHFFYVIYLLLAGNKYTYLDFLAQFFKKNINFEITLPSKILKYFSEHMIYKSNNKFYISDHHDKIEEKINDRPNDLVLYNISNPQRNIKLLKYIIDIIFICIKDNKNVDDIDIIHKLLKMFLINSIEIEEKNIEILMNYLMNYLINIIPPVNEFGHQKYQNNLKKLFELLYYTNFYLNIETIRDKFIINNPNLLNKFYFQIITNILQLFPTNYSAKEYEFSNIIPLIYSYFSTINNLIESNNLIEQKKVIINKIIELVKNNFSNIITKHKYQFNSCHLAIFYFLFFLGDSDNKELLSFISHNIMKFLNIEDFKLDNSDINSLYFIIFNIFILILINQENSNPNIIKTITKKKCNILSILDIKSPIIGNIYKIINEYLNCINPNIKQNEQPETIIKEMDKKENFIKENIKFNVNTNHIDISFMKNESINININNNENKILDMNSIQNKQKTKIEKDLLEKNKAFNFNFQLWTTFALKAHSLLKLKKSKLEPEIKKYENLLKNIFSFYQNRLGIMIGLLKSEEINNNDISLFIPFLSKIGAIISGVNKFHFQKEYPQYNYIINIDKADLNDIVIVLIKDNFHEFEDSILNGKSIIYIKPLPIKSVYSIKINKITNNNISSNIKLKLFEQLDNDINSIFSDYMIIDFNNEKQVNYFYSIINILFYYSLLEQFINL